MNQPWIWVFLGGGVGSLLRYGLSKWLNQAGQYLPYGTLSANILSCILLGFVAVLYVQKYPTQDWLKWGILVGVCGGFSTFSTFSNELFQFMRNGQMNAAMVYLFASLILCNLALGFGGWLGQLAK